MPLRIDWDVQTKPWISNSAYIVIRFGRSRSFRNKLAAVGVTQPARAARIQQDIEQVLLKASSHGADALSLLNIPELYLLDFGDFQMMAAGGIIVKQLSPGGRIDGEFRLVAVMEAEIDELLTDIFMIERYVRAALA